MMTEEEKRKFLKQMGFNPRLLDPDTDTKKKKKKGTFDRQEIMDVYQIFYKKDKPSS